MRSKLVDAAAFALAAPLFPVLAAQGRRVRANTPRLPDASGPCEGVARRSSQRALTLLALGESTVAGVGAAHHEEGLAGQLASQLAARLDASVSWRAVGGTGFRVRDAMARLVPPLGSAPCDLVLVVFGVNDATAFRPAALWKRDLRALLATLEQKHSPRLTVLAGVPPLLHFPALPSPLRQVLALKGRALDLAAAELARATPRVLHVPTRLEGGPELFARDGFHPGPLGYAEWARVLAAATAERLA